ncbi:ABC transporter permease [Pyruvatibacter mobilis]|uniref:Transport permease protein n=1 Tax=Pyruvatibacter mobilis TaxID=1712261 RepID=A0A845Q764_9HYPH|nr:ABC transporter permease [Pyruvatibacter mobilis]QJD73929.1 ABC transporter permease [Pyruvatibacter mobilis]QJD76690.1 ABC transporter permease [Pyruvatibacter mobilis]
MPQKRQRKNLISWACTPFSEVLKHRKILLRTTLNDIKGIYAGSILGILWAILGPIVMLFVYSFTYAVIFRIRPPDMGVTEYILYVFCGLASFISFSGAVTAGTLSLVSNRSVLLNTVFPAELIPLRSVLSASIFMPVGITIVLAGDFFLSKTTATIALVPIVMLLQLMFVTGLCWILSLVALLMRDIQQIIYYSIMMLMVITPIAYTPSMMPRQVAALIYVNPLSYFVISFQNLIMLNKIPPISITIPMVAISFATFIFGYRICISSKSAFYDYA